MAREEGGFTKNVSNERKPNFRPGKYEPLFTHLSNREQGEWHATFKDIESILGFQLPKSASSYPAWWSNGSKMPHSLTWLKAGWRTSDLNSSARTILFRREQTLVDGSRRGAVPPLPMTGARSDQAKAIELSEPENKGGSPDYSLSVESEVAIGLRFYWGSVGKLTDDIQSKLVFPKVQVLPGLYRFTFLVDGKISAYIGESDNLQRRFGHYRNPGPSQATNIRINKLFRDALAKKSEISVEIIIDTAWIRIDGLERLAFLSNKAERLIIENAAIIIAQSDGHRLLNK